MEGLQKNSFKRGSKQKKRVEMKEVSEEGKPAVVCLSADKKERRHRRAEGPDRRRVAFHRAPSLRSDTHRVEAKRQYRQRRTPDSEPARLSCGHASGL